MAASQGFHAPQGLSAAVNASMSGLCFAVHCANLFVAAKNSLGDQLGKRLVPAASKARHRGARDGALRWLGVAGTRGLGGVAQAVFGDLGLRGLVSGAHVILPFRKSARKYGASGLLQRVTVGAGQPRVWAYVISVMRGCA